VIFLILPLVKGVLRFLSEGGIFDILRPARHLPATPDGLRWRAGARPGVAGGAESSSREVTIHLFVDIFSSIRHKHTKAPLRGLLCYEGTTFLGEDFEPSLQVR